MALIPAKCTQCGANIEVDASQEAGICKFCGTAFITEKAINNYNTYITNNNNFAGANVTIQSDIEDVEQYIERAKTFEKLDEYEKSLKVYREIVDKFPMDYRGWIGIVTSKTRNYSKVGADENVHKVMLEHFDKAIRDANPKEQEYILEQKYTYEKLCEQEIERYKNGTYNAQICNLYDYRDVEKALGCNCLTSDSHTFESFTFVLGNYVECIVSYMGVGFKNGEAKVEREYTWDKSTCEKNVDRTNIEELLSRYKKKSESNGGCYIATCVYGSYNCPEVWTLRRFRDYTLNKTWQGRLFIKCYYAISPTIVKWFGNTDWFKTFVKKKLDKMVSALNRKGIENTSYIDKY